MPKRPDVDEPTVTFYCEDCGEEFEVEGTIVPTGDGFDFEPAAGRSQTVYCPDGTNDGDNEIHQISLKWNGSTK